MGSIKIAPSVLSADMANLKGELDKIAGADYVHFDVMDGHFTGNLTFGVDILKAVKRSTDVPVDAHLMVSNPDETVDWYADAGADMITVHYEASTHLHRTLTHLQQRGVKAGVVLNPATPVCVLESIIDVVDMVLLMSVNPGFGGEVLRVDGCCCILFTGESDVPDAVKQMLLDEIARIRAAGVDREIFTLCKNEKYGQLIENLENVEDSASQMADFALSGQTVVQQIEALAALTADDADAALQHILQPARMAMMYIEPDGTADLPEADDEETEDEE